MRLQSVRGPGEQNIVADSRVRSTSVRGREGQKIMGDLNPKMRMVSVRMRNCERKRMSFGNEGGEPRLSNNMSSCVGKRRGDGAGVRKPSTKKTRRNANCPSRMPTACPYCITVLTRPLSLVRHIKSFHSGVVSELKDKETRGGPGTQIKDVVGDAKEVGSFDQEVIELIDISEQDSPPAFVSSAAKQDCRLSGLTQFSTPIQQDQEFSQAGSSKPSVASRQILANLMRAGQQELSLSSNPIQQDEDLAVVFGKKKDLHLPPGFKLPSSISITRLPKFPSVDKSCSEQRKLSSPERIVRILTQNSTPKRKVQMELTDLQIHVMKELGLM